MRPALMAAILALGGADVLSRETAPRLRAKESDGNRVCQRKECGRMLPPNHGNRPYCSLKCRRKARREAK